jgi:nitrogen-specific signal transduction histidine kinase
MQKLASINRRIGNRKLSIVIAGIIIILVILDLFTTRQILYLDNASQIVLFVLTAGIGYGIGSWILLGFTGNITKDLRAKSRLIRGMHNAVILVQFSLLGILLYILYNNLSHCQAYFSLCNGTEPLTFSLNAAASVTATIPLGILAWKFFSWYIQNKRNFLLLLYGLAAAALALSIAGDAFDKLLLVQVVQEKSPTGVIPQSSFIYETFEKYHGEIEYKVVNPQTTTLYVVPSTLLNLYNQIIYWASLLPYILTWAGTALLLSHYYKRTRKLDLRFWILLSVPLVLYLIGSGLIFSLPSDIPYRFYFRLIFRIGTIGSSVLFGLAFYIITRNLSSTKVKDYLTIAAIGIATIGIANEVSALQQTYGVAAHSLILLSSYLFTIGLYSSAISISQDNELRQSIRKSAIEVAKLVDVLGAPKIEHEIQRRVLNTISKQQQVLREQTGVDSSLSEYDMKQYLGTVLKEIKVLKDVEMILNKGKEILQYSNEFLVCSRSAGIRLFYNSYFNSFQMTMEKHRRDEHKGIKLVTSIDQSSIDIVKKFLSIGVQVRHVKNMPPIDFAVSDKEMMTTAGKMESEQEMIQSLLISNEQPYIHQFIFIFEELWKDGIDAEIRIKTIEDGADNEGIDIIQNPAEIQKAIFDLLKAAEKEILVIFYSANAFHRQEYLGATQYLKDVASERGLKVRILTPSDELIIETSRRWTEQPIQQQEQEQQLSKQQKINIRFIEPYLETRVSLLIVDRKFSLVVEVKDDDAQKSYEAMGLATYSNSKPTVSSYVSIFENLWRQTELYQQVKETNEQLELANKKLEIHDKMQQEFIDIAAHELRNPIQPILSLSDIVLSDTNDIKQASLLEIINRNAKRLHRLTEDILDVSRIESKSLYLRKERFNLIEMTRSAIVDSTNRIKKEYQDKIKIELISSTESIFIEADKGRIYQVIHNLLSNAIKFTNEQGIIIITVTSSRTTAHKHGNSDVIIVTIRDNGQGIDLEILPRLFTKFAAKSEAGGTGLGLFISKSIVEAHGGKIWAENNTDGKGATFSVSLPIINK